MTEPVSIIGCNISAQEQAKQLQDKINHLAKEQLGGNIKDNIHRLKELLSEEEHRSLVELALLNYFTSLENLDVANELARLSKQIDSSLTLLNSGESNLQVSIQKYNAYEIIRLRSWLVRFGAITTVGIAAMVGLIVWFSTKDFVETTGKLYEFLHVVKTMVGL